MNEDTSSNESEVSDPGYGDDIITDDEDDVIFDGDNNEHADNVIYLALQKQVRDGFLYRDSNDSETINAI